MNIVYISSLSGNKFSGMSYSVPSQILSQSKIDNVYWYNLNSNYKNDNNLIKCNNKSELIPKIKNFPPPFNRPDIVVFEGFYFFTYCVIAKELQKLDIPYVIIPRGSLTKDAQMIKNRKKKIANLILFNKFASNAKAIQYLTDKEYKTSGNSWNKKATIIPNGINKKKSTKSWQKKADLRGVFIGRLDIYHKGIDLLIGACLKLKENICKANCKIDIYGPDQQGSKNTLLNLISKYELEEIITVQNAIYEHEKESVLLESDFFILTSRFEGHPMGLIEALSYGLPCIVTTGSNMSEEIQRNNAGWTAYNDVNSVAQSLECMLNEKDKISVKGQNALNLSKQFNWNIIARRTHKKYVELLQSEKR